MPPPRSTAPGRLVRWASALTRLGSGRHVLAAGALYGLFLGLVLPWQAARAKAYDAGVGAPDLKLFYSPRELYELLEAYGEAGRAAYIQARFTVDLAWPLVYTYFNLALFVFMASRALGPDSPWVRRGVLICLAPWALDLAENLLNALAAAAFPTRLTPLVWLAAASTALKWLTLSAAMGAVLAALLGRALRRGAPPTAPDR